MPSPAACCCRGGAGTHPRHCVMGCGHPRAASLLSQMCAPPFTSVAFTAAQFPHTHSAKKLCPSVGDIFPTASHLLLSCSVSAEPFPLWVTGYIFLPVHVSHVLTETTGAKPGLRVHGDCYCSSLSVEMTALILLGFDLGHIYLCLW